MVQAAAWPSHASCNSTQPSNPFPSSDPCNFCPNELITISFSWNTPWARPISASEHCHVCLWACAAGHSWIHPHHPHLPATWVSAALLGLLFLPYCHGPVRLRVSSLGFRTHTAEPVPFPSCPYSSHAPWLRASEGLPSVVTSHPLSTLLSPLVMYVMK